MTVAMRSDAEVLNATAGTSVVVSKPSGTADGDMLIAFVGETGVGSITAPAGWTLIGSQAGSTAMTVAVYRKLAAAEGASWTWTLGASVRNWGWVGAFTGVDTSDPIVGSTSETGTTLLQVGDVQFRPHGMLVQCGGAVRAATGAQLLVTSELDTGTVSGTAPATAYIDIQSTMGSNAGAGTDIAGTIGTYTAPWNVDRRGAHWGERWLSNSDTTARIGWNVSLRPAVVATYSAGLLNPTLRAAFGGDPDDSSTWSWTDVTTDVLHDAMIRISSGRTSQASTARPTAIDFAWVSHTGTYHPDNPTSTRYPYIRDGLPIQVTMPYGYASESMRGLAFARVLQPAWDTSTNWAIVNVQALGKLEQARRGQTLKSALYRSIIGVTADDIRPYAYYPFEDGSAATYVSSAISGHPPLRSSGTVAYASDSTLAGSLPLPQMSGDVWIVGEIPPYTDTGRWNVQVAIKVPSEPGALMSLLEVDAAPGGTVAMWKLQVDPGSPATVYWRGYDASGAVATGSGTPLTGAGPDNPSEADYFGRWILYTVGSYDAGGGNYGFHFEVSSGGSNATVSWASGGETAGTHARATAWRVYSATGISVGHLALFTDPSVVFGTGIFDNANALDGLADEVHPTRYLRLYREEGVPAAISYLRPTAYDADPMGAQGTKTLDTHTTEIELVDSGGFSHDSRSPAGEIVLDLRADRYNQPVAMTIDLDQGQLHPPYAPRLDNQRRRTKTVVTVPDGSSATYENDIGRGEYVDPVTINLGEPENAVHWAAWRTHLGTQTGMRHPQISLDLRASPELIADFCALRIGQVVRVTNPPTQQAPDDIDLIVEGIDETISEVEWKAVLHCSPVSGYVVGVLDDDVLGKLDTGGTELMVARSTSDTSWTVHAIDPPKWTTDSGEMPIPLWVAGERLSCTAIANVTAAFVAAGTAVHGDNASLNPGLPAGLQAGDLLLVHATIRNSGTGAVDTPSGYTLLADMSNARLFGKYAASGESAPTVTFTGGVAGASTSAQTAAFRGVGLTVHNVAVQLNSSAQNIAYPQLNISRDNTLVIYLGWKADDWTTTTPPGTKISDPSTQIGDDQGTTWAYTLQTTATPISAGTITVTDGGAAISRGGVVALGTDVQTMTVTRSVNSVSKAQAVREVVGEYQPLRLAL